MILMLTECLTLYWRALIRALFFHRNLFLFILGYFVCSYVLWEFLLLFSFLFSAEYYAKLPGSARRRHFGSVLLPISLFVPPQARENFCTSTRVLASFCPKRIHHQRSSMKQQDRSSKRASSSLTVVTVPQLLFLTSSQYVPPKLYSYPNKNFCALPNMHTARALGLATTIINFVKYRSTITFDRLIVINLAKFDLGFRANLTSQG